jgi:hypothetical protein
MSESRSTASAGTDILLEVRPVADSGNLGPRPAMPEDFRARAGEIADSIAEVADDFRSRLRKVLKRQDESGLRLDSVEIEFGICVQAEAGVVIAKATAGATFTARLVLQASEDHER